LADGFIRVGEALEPSGCVARARVVEVREHERRLETHCRLLRGEELHERVGRARRELTRSVTEHTLLLELDLELGARAFHVPFEGVTGSELGRVDAAIRGV